MVKSYDIQFTGNLRKPWSLYLYEGEDLLDIMTFSTYNDAMNAGEKFLDGHYVSLRVEA